VLRALFAVLVLQAVAGAAEPVLHVRARTRIDLQTILRVKDGLVLRGKLTDVALEQPISGHTVAISIEGDHGFYRYAEPTGADGTFRWRIPLPVGQYTLRLTAGGDEDYAASAPLVRPLDVTRATPVIALEAPDGVSAAQRHVTIIVEAHDPEGDAEAPLDFTSAADARAEHPADLPITLLVGERVVARLRTAHGRVEHELEVAALGRPGAAPVVTARFDGDPLRNPAQAQRTVRVTTPTTLTLAGGGELGWKSALDFTGELGDASGPVAGATVSLWAGAAGAGDDEVRQIAAATTDERGRFTAHVRGGSLQPGAWFVEARFRPPVSWREPSRSPSLQLTALAPQPLPIAFYASPMLTALVLGLVVLARRRPWRAVLERRQRPRAVEKRPSAGLTENRPRLLSTLRPPADHGLSGWVCEAPSGEPVPIATVLATTGEGTRSATVDENGFFAFDALPAGKLTVEASAPGYVAERFERALPHRGELRGARIMLVPIRARIFSTYRAATLPLLPNAAAAETWTPRELLDHVLRRALIVDELEALTRLVEEAYFSARTPDAGVLEAAERLSAAVAARTPPLDRSRSRSL